MGFSDDVALLFKIKADGSQAVGEVGRLGGAIQKEATGIANNFAGAAGGAGRFAASLGPVGLAVGAVAGIVTLAGGAFVGMIARGVELGSRLHDLSLETGLTVETLSGLEGQLKESGTSADALGNAVLFMHKNIGTARDGSKELKTAFANMGVRDLDEALSDTDGTLRKVLKSLGEITDAGERDAAGTKILGRGYKELRVFIADTGGDIDEVMRKAREAGLVMGGEVAGNLDDLGDAWDRLDHKTQVMGANFAGTVAPEITKALDDIDAALSSNITSWNTWAQGAAMAVARIRGGMEGFAKWWHGNTWSPWDLGKQIGESADAGEVGMMTDYYYNMYSPKKPKDKERGGGGAPRGGGKGKSGADKKARAEERGIQLDEKDFDEEFKHESDVLERDYKLRLETLDEFIADEHKLLERWIADKLSIYDREEAAAKKNTKDAAELQNKLKEIDQKRTAASHEFEQRRDRINDMSADELLKAVQARAEGKAKIEDASAKRSIASIEYLAAFGMKRESQAAKEIGDIQLQMHDRAVELLRSRLENEREGSAEYIRIQKEIGAAEVDRAALSEAVANRVAVAKKREADAARQLLEELEDINLQIRQMEIDAWERENKFPTQGEKKGVIASRAEAETTAENERHARVLTRLDNMRTTGAEEKVIHELEEAEERRHNLEMQRIKDAKKSSEDELDPFGPLKKIWGEWKRDSEDSSGSISRSVLVMNQTAVGSINALGGALKEGIKANILYGASIGQALKKALAEQLANIAAESAVRGAYHAAWALGSLAFGNFGSAAKHGAASAAFFALAAGAGLAARALAKSAGMTEGASAGSGATAGQAIAGSGREDERTRREREVIEQSRNTIREDRRGGASNPIFIHVETTARHDPGVLTETIVKTIHGDPNAHVAVAHAFTREYRNNAPVREMLQNDLWA